MTKEGDLYQMQTNLLTIVWLYYRSTKVPPQIVSY